jgi:hypothetical protein
VLKRSNLLGHGKLPFGMTLNIPIRSRIKDDRKAIVTRRVVIGWATMLEQEGVESSHQRKKAHQKSGT